MQPCLNPACLRWGTSLPEFLDAAGSTGFAHVECSIQQAVIFADTYSEAALIELFTSHKITLSQFSGLLPAGPILPAPILIPSKDYEDTLCGLDRRLSIAEQLGCHHASIVLNPLINLEAIEARKIAKQRLRDLANRASNYDIQLAVEFIGVRNGLDPSLYGNYSVVANLPEMVFFLEDLQHSSVGLLFDTFHWFASNGNLSDIDRLPVGAITFVHINDVPLDIPPERLDDSMRLLPGQGRLEWNTLLSAIQANGYLGPASVEIFSPVLWALDAHEAARQAFDSTVRCLESRKHI